MLKDFAPGAQLPVLLYDGEPKTDTVTIEDFLEDKLGPPMSVAGTTPRWGKGAKRGRTGWEGATGTEAADEPARPCPLLSRVHVPAGSPAWCPGTGSRVWPGMTSSISSPASSRTRCPPRMRVRSWSRAHPMHPLRCHHPEAQSGPPEPFCPAAPPPPGQLGLSRHCPSCTTEPGLF